MPWCCLSIVCMTPVYLAPGSDKNSICVHLPVRKHVLNPLQNTRRSLYGLRPFGLDDNDELLSRCPHGILLAQRRFETALCLQFFIIFCEPRLAFLEIGQLRFRLLAQLRCFLVLAIDIPRRPRNKDDENSERHENKPPSHEAQRIASSPPSHHAYIIPCHRFRFYPASFILRYMSFLFHKRTKKVMQWIWGGLAI